MYLVTLNKQAQKDFKKLKQAGLSKKAGQLVSIAEQNPFQSPPPYEGLVGNFTGLFSRRINLKHRFVYKVVEEPVTVDDIDYDGTVVIVSLWSHYESL